MNDVKKTKSGRPLDFGVRNHALTARELSAFRTIRNRYGNSGFEKDSLSSEESRCIQELMDQRFVEEQGDKLVINGEVIGPAYRGD